MKKIIFLISIALGIVTFSNAQITPYSVPTEPLPYKPSIDFDLLMRVNQAKQRAFDNNFNVIQQEVNNILELVKNHNENGDFNGIITLVKDYLNKKPIDYSNVNTAQNIMNGLGYIKQFTEYAITK